MMNNNNYKNKRNRRLYSINGIATTAFAAYGIYKLSSWAWTKWQQLHQENDDNEDNDDATNNKSIEQQQKENNDVILDADADVPSHNDHYKNKAMESHEPIIIHNQSSKIKKSNKFQSNSNHNNRRLQLEQQQIRIRQEQIIKCQHKTFYTFYNVAIYELQTKIESLTNISTYTKQLKQIRKKNLAKNQQQQQQQQQQQSTPSSLMSLSEYHLWNQIKIQTLTRLFTTFYAYTLLYFMIYVQIHLLGGQIFNHHYHNDGNQEEEEEDEENTNTNNTTSMNDYETSHRIVLTFTYQQFLQNNLQQLIQSILNYMQPPKSNHYNDNDDNFHRTFLDVIDKDDGSVICSSRREWNKFLDSFRKGFEEKELKNEEKEGYPLRHHFLLPFVIPNEDDDDDDCNTHLELNTNTTTTTNTIMNNEINENEMAKHILYETWDIMESPLFINTLNTCLNDGFELLKHALNQEIFDSTSLNNTASTGEEEGESVPMAVILSKLKVWIHSFFYNLGHDSNNGSTCNNISGHFHPGGSNGSMMMNCKNEFIKLLERSKQLKEVGDVCFN